MASGRARARTVGRPGAEGFLLEADGQPVDGGATVTVVALLQGHLLVVANVRHAPPLLLPRPAQPRRRPLTLFAS